MTARTLRRAGVAALGLPLVLLAAPALALSPAATLAADSSTGDVAVTNTETVQARLDATGRLQVARLYEQLAFTGHGTTTVVNPTSTQGLRNLDGFGGFSTGDGTMSATVTVDGEERLRTVSDFTGDLPVSVEVQYLLDGEPVAPGAVVGADGTLEVRYTVHNLTTRQDEVTYDDGTGTMVTTTAETVVPLVGQLTTTLPSTFTAVSSDQANLAGDGRGGTKLSFTMTLFPPIGSSTAEFGYTATIRDGKVPAANVSVLPVSPLTSPSFSGGAASYQGGAESGQALTAGATTIDGNLLKLRDGAATLLDGLLQLQDGAAQLSAGLQGEAAPGAQTLAAGLRTEAAPGAQALAAGLDTAHAGASDLAAGASSLATGARSLATGASSLATGAGNLSAGTGTLAAGVGTLASGAGSVAAGARTADGGAQQVASGAAALDAGLAQAGGKVPSLLAGLTQVQSGLDTVDQGLAAMSGSVGGLPGNQGVTDLRSGIASLQAGATNARLGAKSMSSTLSSLAAVLDGLGATSPTVTLLGPGDPRIPAVAGLNQFVTALAAAETDATRKGELQAVASMYAVDTGTVDLGPGLRTLAGVLSNGIVPGLGALQCGLSRTDAVSDGLGCATGPGIFDGLGALDTGLTTLVTTIVASVQGGIGADADTKANGTLRGGMTSLQDGTAQLLAGAQSLIDGLSQLSTGAARLSTGSSQLAAGTAQLAGGTSQLASGTSQLAAGSSQLASGATQVQDGAGRLASGSSQLAAGSAQLAAGSTRLESGTAQLEDGADRLAAGVGRAAAGADQLSDGLDDAADGAGQLSDGLTQAAEGAPALVDGATQLSEQGTSVLVETGAETAADYGVKYAVIEAGAQRTAEESMAYGGPEGAASVTAYSLDLAAVDGSGVSAAGRGAAALALFGVGVTVATLWRRRLL